MFRLDNHSLADADHTAAAAAATPCSKKENRGIMAFPQRNTPDTVASGISSAMDDGIPETESLLEDVEEYIDVYSIQQQDDDLDESIEVSLEYDHNDITIVNHSSTRNVSISNKQDDELSACTSAFPDSLTFSVANNNTEEGLCTRMSDISSHTTTELRNAANTVLSRLHPEIQEGTIAIKETELFLCSEKVPNNLVRPVSDVTSSTCPSRTTTTTTFRTVLAKIESSSNVHCSDKLQPLGKHVDNLYSSFNQSLDGPELMPSNTDISTTTTQASNEKSIHKDKEHRLLETSFHSANEEMSLDKTYSEKDDILSSSSVDNHAELAFVQCSKGAEKPNKRKNKRKLTVDTTFTQWNDNIPVLGFESKSTGLAQNSMPNTCSSTYNTNTIKPNQTIKTMFDQVLCEMIVKVCNKYSNQAMVNIESSQPTSFDGERKYKNVFQELQLSNANQVQEDSYLISGKTKKVLSLFPPSTSSKAGTFNDNNKKNTISNNCRSIMEIKPPSNQRRIVWSQHYLLMIFIAGLAITIVLAKAIISLDSQRGTEQLSAEAAVTTGESGCHTPLWLLIEH